MKYSLRKSFSSRRRKETHEDDHVYPPIDIHGCSNSNLNLVKPVKSKSFLQRRQPSSLPLNSSISSDKINSKVFEPRYDIHSNDDDEEETDDDPFSSVRKPRLHPFDRLTNQIRKSFRNPLTRPRSRLESNNSDKRLIFHQNDHTPTQLTTLYPMLSTGLTSPLVIPNEIEKIKVPKKQRKAPLAPTHMNQSISLPIEINPARQQSTFRRHFSFLLKKRHQTPSHDDIQDENPHEKLTFGQRFHSLRRSLHIGNRNSSQKGNRHLLSND